MLTDILLLQLNAMLGWVSLASLQYVSLLLSLHDRLKNAGLGGILYFDLGPSEKRGFKVWEGASMP